MQGEGALWTKAQRLEIIYYLLGAGDSWVGQDAHTREESLLEQSLIIKERSAPYGLLPTSHWPEHDHTGSCDIYLSISWYQTKSKFAIKGNSGYWANS